MTSELLVGTHEIDVTPDVGMAMIGSLTPRPSQGIEDPLYVKAIVLESGDTAIAYVIIDVAILYRRDGDRAVALASQATGIPEDHIVWTTTHTHTGPYTCPVFGTEEWAEGTQEWLQLLVQKFAECVSKAHAARVPARMSRMRGYHCGLGHNRRLRFKDGRELNTWLIERGEEAQCVGSASVTDPEIGILGFDDEHGDLLAVIFQYTLHANTNFGQYFSGDYPAVVAARIRERYGPEVSTLFVPGACADLNSAGLRYRAVGDALAERIIPKLESRTPYEGPIRLGAMKREVTIQYKDFSADQEERIRASQWDEQAQELFRQELEIMRRRGETETKTILQAWHMGEVSFASLPGEPFVEWGLKMKRESPFPWTYPVELGGDYVGYLVTHQAWEAGGYESLMSSVGKPTPDAVEEMTNGCLDMLRELYRAYEQGG